MRFAWGREARLDLLPHCCTAKPAFCVGASKKLKIHTERKQKVSVHLRTDAREAIERAFQAAVSNLRVTENQSLRIHSRFEPQCIPSEQ